MDKLIKQAIDNCYLSYRFEKPGYEEGMCAGLRTMNGDGEPCEECLHCSLNYINRSPIGGNVMNKDFSIGESCNQLLTRAELIKMIENTFEDDPHSNIAILTTAKAGDYRNPIVSQSLTLSKIIK